MKIQNPNLKMKNNNLKLKIILTLIIFLVVFLLPKISLAANWYVKAGAKGSNNGQDWINAYPQLPQTLNRGDTYYIADGDYPPYTFNTPEDGEKYIVIKKATSNDHGTDVGWDDSYGDGQAVWNSWYITKGYVIFDGVKGTGNNSSSYGFKLTSSSCNFSGTYILVNFGTNSNLSNVEFRHIDFRGCGNTEPNCSYAIKSNSYLGDSRRLIVANSLFYGHTVHIVMYHWNDSILEYNFFDSNWSSSTCHGEQVTFGYSDDVIYRYNIHRNSLTGGLAVHHTDNERWKVYGNIFYGGSVTMGVIGVADSGSNHPDVIKNWEVYNNTIYNVEGAGFGAGFFQGYCTDISYKSKVYNNLFVNTIHPVFSSENLNCVEHDYNSFYNCTWKGSGSMPSEEHIFLGSGNPFVDSTNYDFHLAQPTDPGLILASPFDLDYDGKKRGIDGVWDRGVFEYVETLPPDTTPPAAPRNLRVQ